jgi:hypothetical protein
VSKRNFNRFTEAFLEYSQHVGAPKKFLLWSAISGISSCLERKTWINYNGVQVIYPNTYIMLIADSGIAKKSTATRALTEILYEVDGLHCMSTQLSAASLVEQLRDAGESKTFEFNGVKYKNSSLFAYSSEAKVMLGDANGIKGIQELLTDFYDCGDPNIWSVKKGWNKKTLSGGHITIYNPCLNLLACSTPTWLNEAVGKSGVEGGFASRVLFVTQKERAGESPGWLDESEHGNDKAPVDTRRKLVEDLNQIAKIQGQYKTTKGWKETYNRIQKEVDAKIDEGGDMKSYYSRKMWHLLKLAQILAADQSSDLIVTPKHLEFAVELLADIEPDMYYAFSMKGENRALASLSLVWEIMRKRTSWRKNDLVSSTFKHAMPTQLSEHLRALTDMGKIKLHASPGGGIAYIVLDNTPLGRVQD